MEKEKTLNNLSPFKSMLQKDLDIFINIEEMGERITINSKDYIGVIEHPEKDFSEEAEGINSAISLIIYIKYDSEDKELKKIKIGKSLEINGEIYIVNNIYVEEGMLVIKLEEKEGF